MSHTLFAFPLTEFQTVRVRCVHCGMVFAVGLERLGQLLPEGHCPQCKTKVAHRNDLAALAQAVLDVAGLKEDLEVKFVAAVATVVPPSPPAAADRRAGASA